MPQGSEWPSELIWDLPGWCDALFIACYARREKRPADGSALLQLMTQLQTGHCPRPKRVKEVELNQVHSPVRSTPILMNHVWPQRPRFQARRLLESPWRTSVWTKAVVLCSVFMGFALLSLTFSFETFAVLWTLGGIAMALLLANWPDKKPFSH